MAAAAAFREAVLAVVAAVPEGCAVSYVQVARMVGHPRRPRQVGMVLKGLPKDTEVPWHRVVSDRGHIPSRGRWWGAVEQAARLRAEGIAVDPDGDLDLEACRWDGKA